MSSSPRSARLKTACVFTGFLLLTAACGLKSSAVDNLKAAGANGGNNNAGGTSGGGTSGGGGGGGTSGSTSGGSALGSTSGGSSSTSGGSSGSFGSTGGTSGGGTTGGSSTGGSTSGGSSTGGSSGGSTGGTGGPCGVPSGGNTTGITKTGINIGLHAPLTGTGTPFPNSSFQKGSQVFFDQPENTICGRKVHVDFEDDTYTPDGANKVCSQFAKTSFLAIGGAGTDQIQACATNTDINSTGTPYLSAGVTDNGLNGLKNYFAVSLTYKQQGTLVVRNAITQGFAKPKPASTGKQWEIITGKSANFDSATTGIVNALKAAGISYNVDRFDQNSGNYDNAATQLGQNLALQGYKTIFTDAAPGVFVFVTTGYYNASPTGNGVRWTGPGVTFTDFLIAQLTCQASKNAINGAADYLAPSPGIDHATDDFKKAFGGNYDDIEWGLWGLDQAVFTMLKASSSNLTRQHFTDTVLNGSFSAGVFAPSVFKGSHFGGSGAWVQRINCSKNNPDQPNDARGNGSWDTVGSTYLKP